MRRKSYDYRKKMDNNRKIHRQKIKRMVASSAVASALVFQPFVPVIQNGQLIGFAEDTASAATLAEVGLLRDVAVSGSLGNLEGTGPYNLNLSLTGTGLADVELVNPQTVAVFHAPELAGDLIENNPTAQVNVELLPINASSIPGLGNALDGITGNLDSVVGDLVSAVDVILSNPLTSPLIDVQGLDELEGALAALNNLDSTVFNILEYNATAPAVVNTEDGIVTVDFSEGLGNHLNSAVNDVVEPLLQDVADAIENLDIELLSGTISVPLAPVQALLQPVLDLVNNIADGTTNLTSGLVSAQVIGRTTVSVDVAVERDTDATGLVSISGSAINAGTNVIDAELLSDLDGVTQVAFPADTTAPEVPIVNEVTSEATEVTGTAEPGSTVTVNLPGGVTTIGTTNEEGAFSAPIPEGVDLVGGETLTVIATDEAGNPSDPATVNVVDTTAPETPTIDRVTTDSTVITGTAEPNSNITVTLPNGQKIVGTTNADGVYSASIPAAIDLMGNETITVVAADAAGNESGPATTVVVDLLDETPPAAPDVNEVTSEDTEITGTAEPNSTVTVEFPTGETAEGVTNAGGAFTVAIPEEVDLVGGEELLLVATDVADNDSDPTAVTVTDATAPAAPIIDPVGDDVTEITGETEPGSAVTVTLPDGEEVTGTTDEDGNFVVTLPEGTELEVGDILTVIATDEAGNASDAVEVTVEDLSLPVISEIEDLSALEKQPITDIVVEVNEESEVTTAGLPSGLSYDEASGLITGTPVIEEWGTEEEERPFTVTVTAIDPADNAGTEEFVLTIQRDTDGDGIPDIEDTDDDNDGVSDGDEEDAGTEPKDETDFPEDIDPDTTAPIVTAIDDITVIEGLDIEDIGVETDDETSVVTVDGLPAGLDFDAETDRIFGAPVIEDWEADEEERTVDVSVAAMDHSGNESEAEEFAITIQRDTDRDGIPDSEDEDDDGDGFTDEEEIENGTDPKDETDFPDVIAPDAPVIEGVTSEDTEVVGSAEPNSEVIVTLPNGDTVTGITDENGNFVVVLPEDLDLTGGEVLEVVVVDEAGNTSEVTPITVSDMTAPIIVEVEDQTVVEGLPIEDIEVVVENPGEEETPSVVSELQAFSLIQPFAAPIQSVGVVDLPDGVSFDPETMVISGTPVVSDWAADEEERDFVATVVARDAAGNEAADTFTITVQRDTDGDGDPDVTDPDDDNDGATDEEEIEAGTDPKDETDVPEDVDMVAPVISIIEDLTAIENQPIEDILVEVNEPSAVVVDGLPSGVSFDEETGLISGAPAIGDWAAGEEERGFEVTVTATDAAGNESSETFAFVVQRDTDEDGDPDVTDPDDDNDGAIDEEEEQAGTDPRDDNDTSDNTNGGINDPSDGNNQGGDNGSFSGDGQDQATLPQTGESQNIFTMISGFVMASLGAVMLALKKKKGLNKKK